MDVSIIYFDIFTKKTRVSYILLFMLYAKKNGGELVFIDNILR